MIVGNFNFIDTNYFPNPLSYSCPRIYVLVSSHIIGACRVLPMALFLDLTFPTIMVDVHTVSVGPAVSSNATDVLTVHSLGVCLPLSVYWYSGPPVVFFVRLSELLG